MCRAALSTPSPWRLCLFACCVGRVVIVLSCGRGRNCCCGCPVVKNLLGILQAHDLVNLRLPTPIQSLSCTICDAAASLTRSSPSNSSQFVPLYVHSHFLLSLSVSFGWFMFGDLCPFAHVLLILAVVCPIVYMFGCRL